MRIKNERKNAINYFKNKKLWYTKGYLYSKIKLNTFNMFMTINKRELLTPREIEVYNLLETGLLYKEIADRLDISMDTVKKHCKNIYAKLEVRNRTEAIML